MTTRERAIEIAAMDRAKRCDVNWDRLSEVGREAQRRFHAPTIDALLAAGVIPAEGTVVVDANVANKIVRMWDARANLKAMQLKNARRMATSQSACDEVNRAGFSWQAATVS